MQPILDNMIRQGLLDEQAAQRASSMLDEGKPFEEALLAADGLSEERLLRFLSETFAVPYVELENRQLTREFLASFPARLLIQHNLLPLEQQDDAILVATSKLWNPDGIDELGLACGKDIRIALAPASEIERCIKRFLGVGADTIQSLDDAAGVQVIDTDFDENIDLANAAQDASIIKFVNEILTEAIELRATDVHIEPFEDQLRVRYRVDGILQAAPVPQSLRRFHAAIVSRLKILSHLDIAEKRLPQDGRIKLKIAGREIDVRVSIIPMIHGEAVVLRILHRNDAILGTERLGMAERDARAFERLLDLPHGIILVTGPTGSGKTTTLYAALSKINDIERKIVTIEDPVEYQLKGVNQIQVSTKTGLTFAMGLRSILRHDPDVVLVGEIRDRETAEIAVQASLTGHLVFSTLHTNDAPGAATRLVDMGIEPYLVSSSVEAVIAQRLVRVICKHCKTQMPEDDLRLLRAQFRELIPPIVHHGKGCRQCQNTGYRGRTGIFEVMLLSDEIRTLVLNRAPSHEIRKAAVRQGMNSLREDGWRLVGLGITTPDEVLTNTKDEAASIESFTTDYAALAQASQESSLRSPSPGTPGEGSRLGECPGPGQGEGLSLNPEPGSTELAEIRTLNPLTTVRGE